MSVSSKADLLRAQLNLKNLRRHDPLIEEILGSTPYVTVYYNTGADWIKTGIEGPMFLFSRSTTPRYGFFVLNRQGLEYVQEFLTPDSDVKVEGDFILYEPHDQADRATGIWIAEEKDRIDLCRRMDEIRAVSQPAAPTATAPAPTAVPYNQSISLDMLFASSSSPSAVPKPSPPATASSNHPTLDMLFASTSPQPAAQTLPIPLAAASAPAGMSLLDSIFKSAAQTPPPPPAAPAPAQPKPNDAAALLAMMGLGVASPLSQAQSLPAPPPQQQQQRAPPAPVPSQAPSAPKPAPTATASAGGPSPFAPPLLSHDIFASLPLPGAGSSNSKKVPSPVVASRLPPQQPQPTASQPLPPRAPPSQPAQQATTGSTSSSVEQKLAAAIQAEKERIARSISGPPASLAPASVSVERKVAAPPSPVVNGVAPGGRSNGSPAVGGGVKKNVVLGLLDEALEKKGLLGAGAGGGEPVGQAEFVREVMGLLQKPAFATALYARYLERCEEE